MAGADCPAAAAGAVDDRVFALSISTIKSALVFKFASADKIKLKFNS
jgi:hypothetical protein